MGDNGGVEESQGQGDGLVHGYQGGEGNRNYEGHVEEVLEKIKSRKTDVHDDHKKKEDA